MLVVSWNEKLNWFTYLCRRCSNGLELRQYTYCSMKMKAHYPIGISHPNLEMHDDDNEQKQKENIWWLSSLLWWKCAANCHYRRIFKKILFSYDLWIYDCEWKIDDFQRTQTIFFQETVFHGIFEIVLNNFAATIVSTLFFGVLQCYRICSLAKSHNQWNLTSHRPLCAIFVEFPRKSEALAFIAVREKTTWSNT